MQIIVRSAKKCLVYLHDNKKDNVYHIDGEMFLWWDWWEQWQGGRDGWKTEKGVELYFSESVKSNRS